MEIKGIRVGPIQTNCYMAYDDTACVIFDPGYSAGAIVDMLEGRKLDLIILTHGHMDHIGGLPDLVARTGAPIAACKYELERIKHPEKGLYDEAYVGYEPVEEVERLLDDGEVFEVGDMSFRAMHTPGHTEGSMCYYCEDSKVLFSGDTLFQGSCGRTDFTGGDPEAMRRSLARLVRELPDDTAVLPGHEGLTTIGNESRWIERYA